MGGHEGYQARLQFLYEDGTNSILIGTRYQSQDSSANLYDFIPLYESNPGGDIALCSAAQSAVASGEVTESDIQRMRETCVDGYGFGDQYRDGPYETHTANNGNSDDFEGKVDTWGVKIRADIGLDSMTLTSVTGIDRTDSGGWDPQGHLYASIYDVEWITKVNLFSQELRLSSDSSSPHKWIAGVSYLENKIDSQINAVYDFNAFTNPTALSGATFPAVLPDTDFSEDVDAVNPILGVQDSREAGQVDWALSDALTLVTGLRWSWYEKDFHVSSEPFYSQVTQSLRDTGISFNLGLNYTLEDGSLVYGKIAQGVKSGSHYAGFSFSPADSVGAGQEELLSYEAGFKKIWFDSRTLSTNVSMFFYEYSDLQSTLFSSDPVTGDIRQVYANVGDAEVLGLDADIVWAPIDSVYLRFSYTHLDTEITDSIAFGNVPGTNVPDTSQTIEGNELSTAPDNQFTFLGRYIVALQSDLELTFQYDMSFTGDQWRSVDNEPFQFDEATTIHNASIILASNDGKWEASVWGKNLSDELDMTWQFTLGGI